MNIDKAIDQLLTGKVKSLMEQSGVQELTDGQKSVLGRYAHILYRAGITTSRFVNAAAKKNSVGLDDHFCDNLSAITYFLESIQGLADAVSSYFSEALIDEDPDEGEYLDFVQAKLSKLENAVQEWEDDAAGR